MENRETNKDWQPIFEESWLTLIGYNLNDPSSPATKVLKFTLDA
jgi:hypothetical protein